ncbi:speckle-type POZ protein-like [Belonocnema kinseyi]|uniref:speckle-type POZ protein-like n=1 Tax=Belonocnema kinseyi TaxID=2817044 RepID=UPI00143DE911|nr:speckle-type POZ protein-like [Belonocnema kinseyi]
MTDTEKLKQSEIQICSETRLKRIAAKLKWVITDFHSLSSDRNKKRFPVLESSAFLLQSNNRDKSFKISFQYDYCFLQITSIPAFPKDVTNVCSILDKDGKTVWQSKMFIRPLYRVSLPVKILLREKQKYLANNALRILFKIEIIEDLVTEYTTDSNVSPAFSNLERFLEDQTICDVTFLIGDQEFRAHKIILAIRSPAFLAMFTHEFSEQRNSKARISDIRPEVFKALLRYVYNAEIESMSEIAAELLIAADKYLLEDLKIKCERFLIAKSTKEKASYLLQIAKRHNCANLELYCRLCLSENKEENVII